MRLLSSPVLHALVRKPSLRNDPCGSSALTAHNAVPRQPCSMNGLASEGGVLGEVNGEFLLEGGNVHRGGVWVLIYFGGPVLDNFSHSIAHSHRVDGPRPQNSIRERDSMPDSGGRLSSPADDMYMPDNC